MSECMREMNVELMLNSEKDYNMKNILFPCEAGCLCVAMYL